MIRNLKEFLVDWGESQGFEISGVGEQTLLFVRSGGVALYFRYSLDSLGTRWIIETKYQPPEGGWTRHTQELEVVSVGTVFHTAVELIIHTEMEALGVWDMNPPALPKVSPARKQVVVI